MSYMLEGSVSYYLKARAKRILCIINHICQNNASRYVAIFSLWISMFANVDREPRVNGGKLVV
jgi:hypothetical protein